MTEPKLMRWWRVELDRSGAIKSCDEVENASRNGNHVRFVEAPTKASACSEAKAWYRRFRDKKRASSKARIQRLKAAGVCIVCGKMPPVNATCCKACNDRKNERIRQRKNGAPLLINREEDPERVREREQRHSRESQSKARNAGKTVLGFHLRPSDVRHIKRLFDELGPVAFRAKLCEVVPDEPQQQAEAAE